MEAYRRGILNGTDNADIQLLSIKAEWMMNGGKTSEDWNRLSISDVKLLTIDHYAKEERLMKIIAHGVNKGLFGDKKSQGGIGARG